jgi:hypothetical protein
LALALRLLVRKCDSAAGRKRHGRCPAAFFGRLYAV